MHALSLASYIYSDVQIDLQRSTVFLAHGPDRFLAQCERSPAPAAARGAELQILATRHRQGRQLLRSGSTIPYFTAHCRSLLRRASLISLSKPAIQTNKDQQTHQIIGNTDKLTKLTKFK